MPRATNSDRPRRQADEWVMAGLRTLASGSIADVKVERLAKDLGVTKGSFYWHFDDRAALLDAMRRRWIELDTDAVIDTVAASDPSGNQDPAAAIETLFGIVLGEGGEGDGIEAAMREWSASDPEVAATCRAVDERRVTYVSEHLVTIGFDPATARGRAEVLYRIVIGEYVWRRYGGQPLDPTFALDAVAHLIQPTPPPSEPTDNGANE